MKAMITTNYGSPDVFKLENVAKPVPAPNEILIKVHASSVTKADTMMRTGSPFIGRLFTGLSKPKHAIWGTGFAGVVEAVGSEVTQFKAGHKVFGESIEKMGTYAEYLALPENGIVTHLPENLSYEEAAGMCGATARAIWNKPISSGAWCILERFFKQDCCPSSSSYIC